MQPLLPSAWSPLRPVGAAVVFGSVTLLALGLQTGRCRPAPRQTQLSASANASPATAAPQPILVYSSYPPMFTSAPSTPAFLITPTAAKPVRSVKLPVRRCEQMRWSADHRWLLCQPQRYVPENTNSAIEDELYCLPKGNPALVLLPYDAAKASFGKPVRLDTVFGKGGVRYDLRVHEFDWSRDGKTLVGVDLPGNVRVYDLATGRSRLVQKVGLDITEYDNLAISPNGKRVVFSREEQVEPDGHNVAMLWIAQADGTGKHRLVQGRDPAWTPDGNSLMYVKTGGKDLALYNLVQKREQILARARDYAVYIRSPFFTEDGRGIIALVNGKGSWTAQGITAGLLEMDLTTQQWRTLASPQQLPQTRDRVAR